MILMDMILRPINNPSSSKMVAEIPLKKQGQAPLSSTVTIRQCLPCVQEGLSVLQRPKFSLCIGHFARFDLRHFTLPVLFVLRGETTPGLPAVPHSLSLPSHESKSTREHLRTGDMAGPTGLGKSKRRYRGNLLKIEWQVGNVSNLDKKAGVSSCHV